MIRESEKRAAVLARQLQAFGRRQTLRAGRDRPRRLPCARTAPLVRRAVGDRIEAPPRDPGAGARGTISTAPSSRRSSSRSRSTPATRCPTAGRSPFATAAVDGHAGDAPRRTTAWSPARSAACRSTDTGPAIDPDALPHVFEPFYSTRQMGRGTGLGLATIEGIVSQSHGCIEVASGPASARRSPSTSRPRPSSRSASPAPPRHAAVPRRARCCSSTTRSPSGRVDSRACSASLGCVGARGGAAPTRRSRCRTRRSRRVDLVVTDVLMPGMDGGALSDRLRERRPRPARRLRLRLRAGRDDERAADGAADRVPREALRAGRGHRGDRAGAERYGERGLSSERSSRRAERPRCPTAVDRPVSPTIRHHPEAGPETAPPS